MVWLLERLLTLEIKGNPDRDNHRPNGQNPGCLRWLIYLIDYIKNWCRRRDLSRILDFIGSQACYGDSPQPLEVILDHIEAFYGPNLLPGFPHTSNVMTQI